MNSTPAHTRYHALDSLRGIAAFIVVLGHCYGVLPPEMRAHLHWLKEAPFLFFTNGRAAVMLFFVLSGFVLALPYAHDKGLPYGRFILRRLCRLCIPYAAAIILSYALFLLTVHGVTDAPDLAEQTWGGRVITPVLLAGHLFMTGIWDHIFLDQPIWSLVHETRISLIFPLLVVLCAKPARGIAALLLIAVFSALAVSAYGSFAFFPVMTDSVFSTFLATAYIIPCFMLGILLAQNRATVSGLLGKRHKADALLWVAALVVFASCGAFEQAFAVALASALVIALTLSSHRATTFLSVPALRWLGRVSYSLYLTHLPVIFALVLALHGFMGYGGIILVALPCVLVVAEVMCRFVEIPAIRLGKSLTR